MVLISPSDEPRTPAFDHRQSPSSTFVLARRTLELVDRVPVENLGPDHSQVVYRCSASPPEPPADLLPWKRLLS